MLLVSSCTMYLYQNPSRLSGDSTRVPPNYYSSPLGDGSEFKPLQGELIEEPSFNKTNTSRSVNARF